MKITKFGHSCLFIQEKYLRILIDPGSYSSSQNEATDINVVLITQEHPEHLDFESLTTIIADNPEAKIYTNKGVGQILTEKNIPFFLLEHG